MSGRTIWRAAYQKTFGAHTLVDTEAKNDARKAAAGVTRPFIAQYLMFPPVTNEDRTALGVHNKDTHPSSIGEPKTRPVITDIRATGGFHSPFTHTLPPEAQACFFSCAARWQNGKGEMGPWGDVQHVVVG